MIRRYTSRVFYGWWMVAAATAIQLLIAGLLMQSYGAYVAVLQEQRGWSKTALSGAISLTQVISGLVGPFQGPILDRVGTRVTMRIGFIIFGIGFILLSQVQSLWQYYAVFVLMAVGFSFTAFFPLTVAMVNWFERKRARVLSTMSLGFAGGGLLVPLIAFSLEHWGWRETAFTSGILMMVIGIPLAQVMRRRPEDYGEVVDGIRKPEPPVRVPAQESVVDMPAAALDTTGNSDTTTTNNRPSRDFTLREAMHTPAFWLISLGHGSALFVVGAVSVHVISHLKEDLGYSVGSAALVVTLMTVFQIIGMLIGARSATVSISACWPRPACSCTWSACCWWPSPRTLSW